MPPHKDFNKYACVPIVVKRVGSIKKILDDLIGKKRRALKKETAATRRYLKNLFIKT